MSSVFKEFADQNLHRAYPLVDSAGGVDQTNIFTLPTSLISDIYLCAPYLPNIDVEKFYIENVLIRRMFVEITIGYDDPQVSGPIGVFKNISTSAALHTKYDFTPFETQTNDQFAPLFFMTGQITIGDPAEAVRSLGSWNFSPTDDEHSTIISPTRVGKGLLNVQYISINNRLLTGNVKLAEGDNINLDVEDRTVNGVPETVVTIDATLTAGSALQLASDEDILNELIDRFGIPIQTINGLLPDATRNFGVTGADCTTVEPLDNGIVISNPCATPCCDQDPNVAAILESIQNLNLRYSQLKAYYDAADATITNLQNKLLVLGTEV